MVSDSEEEDEEGDVDGEEATQAYNITNKNDDGFAVPKILPKGFSCRMQLF